MRNIILVSVFLLAACSPRFEAARQCQSEANAMPGHGISPYGLPGILTGVTVEQDNARNEFINDCITKATGG